MTSRSRKQTIAIHILPSISRSKSNQTMKGGHLLESRILIQKSFAKFGGETSSRPFSEKPKVSAFSNQQFKVLYSLFLLHAKLRTIEIYDNQAADHLLLPHMKLKKKSGLKVVFLPHFLHNF